MFLSDQQAKELILSIGRKMADARFVSANDGNITMRCAEDAVWATPTGVNKGELTKDMLIKVRIADGKVLEGAWAPTSELEMHLNVYRTDDEIVSTCHAHPLYMTTLACAGIDLDLPSTPAAVCIAGKVPVIPYFCSGSRELAECVIPYVKDYHVVNLGNHGPISWGKSPKEAWYRLEDAEASAQLALELMRLGRVRPLNPGQVREVIDFHHIDITDKAIVSAWESKANQQPSISFTELMRRQVVNEDSPV